MPILYGIWIPGQGWLRANNICIAFEHKQVAENTAKRCGNRATAEFIDDSLQALEPYLLSVENNRKTWKDIFKAGKKWRISKN